jgi:ankyrin repeat protein
MEAKKLPARPSLEQYKKQAKTLVKSRKSGDPEALRRIRQNHPQFRKLPEAEFLGAKFALADAQLVIAREHAFESWPKFAKYVEAVNREHSPVSQFESAADAVIAGDVDTLESLLRENPALIRERSTRAHRATLLHYVAANGVEDYRQKSPRNAALVAETLLKAGAEVDAPADTYGGGSGQTTMNLLVSSVHPAKAGVQAAVVETLLDFGAAIDGLDNAGWPLVMALAFNYLDAAETLARRGARVGDVVTAAALGREEMVKGFFNADGSLKADAPLLAIPWLKLAKDPTANLETALVWAARFGRAGVVEFLLQKGVDPGAKDGWGFTALHSAADSGHPEAVEALLKWNAPLEAKNEYDATPLDQTVWVTVHEVLKATHIPILQKLIDAGAIVDPDWLRADLNPPLDRRVAEALRRGVRRE